MTRRDHRRRELAAPLMAFEASTLAVMSSLHLSGALAGGGKPFERSDAGIAEAIICLALLGGAAALLRARTGGRPVALATLVFAIVGFIIGLNFTVRGGDAIDIAYHAALLPLLFFTGVVLWRQPKRTTPNVDVLGGQITQAQPFQ